VEMKTVIGCNDPQAALGNLQVAQEQVASSVPEAEATEVTWGQQERGQRTSLMLSHILGLKVLSCTAQA
jgi:hypothetical protein